MWANPGAMDIRFPGQWFQLETGLAYNWHRHYDASLGRYIQPDPIGLAGGGSLYGYVGQNPLSYIDPEGKYAGTIIGGEIGTAVLPGPGTAIGAVLGMAAGAAARGRSIGV
jgi:RHS repeat-associated protein